MAYGKKMTEGDVYQGTMTHAKNMAEDVGYDENGDEEYSSQNLDNLSLTLAKIRSEAIDGRAMSGIEDEWVEDEEYYEGIDDSNRREHRAWRTKPLGQLGLPSQDHGTTSTIFLNITRAYVDTASAKTGDMLLPTDDRAWSIDHTPIPGMKALVDGNLDSQMIASIEQRYPDNQEAQQAEAQAVINEAKRMAGDYKEKADNATKQIEDWHIECQFHAEMRRVIDDTAKVGSGVLKGPTPVHKKQVMYKDGVLIIQEALKPISRRIDYWNFYPDPGCGENIHDGGYTWERDDITKRKLQDMINLPGYNSEQIMHVLREGPLKATKEVPEMPEDLGRGIKRESKHLYEIWYYHGDLEAEDVRAWIKGSGFEGEEDLEVCGFDDIEDIEDGLSYPINAVLVNNRIIKAVINPLDTKEYPYDVMPWQSRKGMPWGTGVARQIRTAQNIVKGAARNMMDNAGRAGGPQVVIKRGVVEPADGIFEVTPWKIWLAAEDADLDHLDNAFRFVVIPMLQQELEKIIYLGLKLAEDTTGLPMLLQGQVGMSTPKTLGGQQMMQNNASSVLRRVARLYDDKLTEPHIRRYYVYLLQYGDDNAKGDFLIDARGSSALVERELQAQNIATLGNLVNNPVFGVDPKRWMQEYLKSQKLDPKRFDFDDDEWKQIVEKMSQPPEVQNPAIEIATIRAQVDQMKSDQAVTIEKMRIDQASKEKDADLTVKVMEAEKDRALEMAVEYMKREIEGMRLAGNKEVSLDQIEAKLADSAMRLRAQLKIAGESNATRALQVATPAIEPPGRAPDGQAFQK